MSWRGVGHRRERGIRERHDEWGELLGLAEWLCMELDPGVTFLLCHVEADVQPSVDAMAPEQDHSSHGAIEAGVAREPEPSKPALHEGEHACGLLGGYRSSRASCDELIQEPIERLAAHPTKQVRSKKEQLCDERALAHLQGV